jgi:hypothetical protein
MATAIGRARSARAAFISTLALVALAVSAGGVSAAPPVPFSTDQASLDFGSILVSESSSVQTVTVFVGRKAVVLEAGTDNGAFTIQDTGTCTTAGYQLAANSSCTIDLLFAPLVAGSLTNLFHLDSCLKWEISGATGLPHCLRVKDSVTVSLSGSGFNS